MLAKKKPDRYRNVLISTDDAVHEKARLIGDGNTSLGYRLAVLKFKTPQRANVAKKNNQQ